MSPRLSPRPNKPGTREQRGPNSAAYNANDTPARSTVPRRRSTAASRSRAAAQLGPTERELLDHLAVIRLATSGQLGRLLDSAGSPSAHTRRLQRTLRRLTAERAVTRLEGHVGGRGGGSTPPVYALDVLGQHATGNARRPRRPWLPGPSFVNHVLAVTELYATLHEGRRAGTIELLGFEAEPAAWRPTVDRHGAPTLLKPDAFVHLAKGEFEHLAFIEVDLATESLPTIARKADVYYQHYRTGREQRHHGVYPLVVWLVPDRRRHQGLMDTLGRLPAEQWRLHRVATMAAVPEVLLQRPPPPR